MYTPRRELDANVVGQAAQLLCGRLREATGEKSALLPFITISREFGCQGTPLAANLVNTLNRRLKPAEGEEWIWYDRQLLDKIAEDQDVKKEVIISAEKGDRGGVNQYLAKILSDTPDDYDLYQYVVSAVGTLVERGNVVIVGRGGAILTRGLDNGVHIRLYAGMDFKLAHARETFPDLPENTDELKAIIERETARRESFVEKFTEASADDPMNYDLIINNGRVDVPAMTDIVLDLLRHRGLVPPS